MCRQGTQSTSDGQSRLPKSMISCEQLLRNTEGLPGLNIWTSYLIMLIVWRMWEMLSKSQPKQDANNIRRSKMLFCKRRNSGTISQESNFVLLLWKPQKILQAKNTIKYETNASRSNSNRATRLDPAKTHHHQGERKEAANDDLTSASSEKNYDSRPTPIKPSASPIECLLRRRACLRNLHGHRWPERREGFSETKALRTMIWIGQLEPLRSNDEFHWREWWQ